MVRTESPLTSPPGSLRSRGASFTLVVFKEMRRREVEAALIEQDCKVLNDRGPHTKWGCPCGAHITLVPRHTHISPGVVQSIGKQLACLPGGWLQ